MAESKTKPVTAAKTPAVKAPAVKAPAAKVPVAKTPAVKAPAVKAPAVKAPVAKTPTAKVPATKAPAVKVAPAKKAPASKVVAKTPPAKVGGGAKKAPVAKTSVVAKKPAVKKVTGPTVAVFIDIENANVSRDNLLEVFEQLNSKATVTYGKLYGYRFDKAADFDEIVAENRLETVGRMRFKDGEDSVVDTRLVVDSIIAAGARKYDSIFVWAGVGDLMTLFAHIKQLGCRVITVDLPVFDCANKFVDQKLRLYSPHTMNRKAPAAVAPVATYSAAAAAVVKPAAVSGSGGARAATEDIMAGRVIPALPRKDGAPVLGGSAPNSFGAIADDDDEDEDEDDFDLDDLEDLDDDLDDLDDLDELDDDSEFLDDNFENDDDEDDDEEFEELDDDDMDDFDDLGDDDEEDSDEPEELDEEENARLLALTNQLLRDMKEGKPFDAKKAAESVEVDEAKRVLGGGDLGDLGDDGEGTAGGSYGSAALQYDAEASAVAPDGKEKIKDEEEDDFNDFGKL
jgi:hypothetical protein